LEVPDASGIRRRTYWGSRICNNWFLTIDFANLNVVRKMGAGQHQLLNKLGLKPKLLDFLP
ncbi:MAG: hypothetical protein ACREUY_07020, partial [Burkholderiales bacterium]